MDELSEIQNLCSEDIAVAKKAWEALQPIVRSYLLQILVCPSYIEREDVVGTTMTKIWRARTKWINLSPPKFQSVSAWKGYIRTTGLNTLRDDIKAFQKLEAERRATGDLTSTEIKTDWPFEHSVSEFADALWLKSNLQLSAKERKIRVIAAQYFYLHKASWQEILPIVSRQFRTVDRQTLDDWLDDEATLNNMAFKEMHTSGVRLCRYLLNPEGRVEIEAITRILKNEDPDHGNCPGTIWSHLEAKILVLRFGNGLKDDNIKGQCRSATDEIIRDVVARASASLPFTTSAKKLKSVFPAGKEFPLSTTEFWRRIAYQYREVEDLPFKQIEERTIEPAAHAGYSLNQDMLTTWLSGGRLVETLSKFVRTYISAGGTLSHE